MLEDVLQFPDVVGTVPANVEQKPVHLVFGWVRGLLCWAWCVKEDSLLTH